MTCLSQKPPSKIWAMQKRNKVHGQESMMKKKRKDAYPKKVCHMSTRHVEKKEEKKKI